MKGVLLLLLFLSNASCLIDFGSRLREKRLRAKVDTLLPEKYGPFFYDQPVDHFKENSTTFKHRYWANADYYQHGGPVILYNAGESPADARAHYVINSTMFELAKRLKGIVLVMEHRFYGLSLPSTNYTAETLTTLNTAQALEDMADFIRFAKVPDVEIAPESKYIVYGGSYSGNLAAWMRLKYPDLVFAAVPSSAPVQMKFNYFEYFDPIHQYGPTHCIHAIKTTILHVDHILFSPFAQAKKNLKAKFGLEDLEHDDDFADTLSFPLGLWQNMSPTSNPFVEEFCSIFEGLTTVSDYLDAYGRYIQKQVKEACEDTPSVSHCLSSRNPENYKDVDNPSRAWLWQVCTEYAYWQTSSPIWRSTLVSRKLQASWYQRQCPLAFGEHNIPSLPKWKQINQEYKGWFLNLDRVFWIDGEWDPWRTLSVQSNNAPNRAGWAGDAHYVVLPKSVHHWDFFTSDSVSEAIKSAQNQVFHAIQGWLEDERQATKQIHLQY
ncbi:serine carboxypeptidase S28-domain-containing protein [Sporodiniella umbellata]|nr:serine carboxypeptidase S28-domain-containing protein [Sporodiniella umbellata]